MRGKVHNFDVVNDFTCSLLSDLNTSRSDSAIVLSKTKRCDKNYCALRLSTLRLFFQEDGKMHTGCLHPTWKKTVCQSYCIQSLFSTSLYLYVYLSVFLCVSPYLFLSIKKLDEKSYFGAM